jgi:hypothetical protein
MIRIRASSDSRVLEYTGVTGHTASAVERQRDENWLDAGRALADDLCTPATQGFFLGSLAGSLHLIGPRFDQM